VNASEVSSEVEHSTTLHSIIITMRWSR